QATSSTRNTDRWEHSFSCPARQASRAMQDSKRPHAGKTPSDSACDTGCRLRLARAPAFPDIARAYANPQAFEPRQETGLERCVGKQRLWGRYCQTHKTERY